MDHYLLLLNTSISLGFLIGMILITIQDVISYIKRKHKSKQEYKECQDRLDEIKQDLDSIKQK